MPVAHPGLTTQAPAHRAVIWKMQSGLENYIGCHESLSDYAGELIEDTTPIPVTLVNYIDYEAIAHDMKLNGDVFTIEQSFREVHVFHSL